MKLTDSQFVAKLTDNLTRYQNVLIELAQTGHTENQSIIPTVTVTFEELRKITGRTRIRNALIVKLVGLLEDEGLEVDVDESELVITKPPEDMPTEFESFRSLDRMITDIRKEID